MLDPLYQHGDLLQTTCERNWGLGKKPNLTDMYETVRMPEGTVVEFITIVPNAWSELKYQLLVWVPTYQKYSITDVDKYKLISCSRKSK